MNKVKYILKDIYYDIKKDVIALYYSFGKPTELLNIMFIVAVIQIISGKMDELIYTLGFIIVVYVWKIIKQGHWRRRMREDYKP